MPEDGTNGRSIENPNSPQGGARRVRGVLSWMFRNRTNGRVTVAQVPNWPLILWAVAAAGQRLADPGGRVREFLVVVAFAALAVWAGWEVLGGVNPFRRSLGGAALGWLVYSVVTAA